MGFHRDSATGESGAADRDSFDYDTVLLRLLFAWTFLQCFFYGALPYLRWNVGIGINITPDKLVFVGLLAVQLLRYANKSVAPPTVGVAATSVGWFLSAFTLVCLISWQVNDADGNNKNFAELTRAFNLSVFPAVAYFTARSIRYSRRMLKELLLLIAMVGAYLGVTAVAEHYQIAALVYPKYILDPSVGVQFGRSRGPFANTIGNGGMLLLSFAACGCLAVSERGPKRVAAIVLTLLLLVSIYFTETRSIWLGLAAFSVTVIALPTPLRKTGLSIFSILALAFVVGIGSKFSAFDESLFSRRQNTVDYRLDNYEIAWAAFKANPIFGLGYGGFRKAWDQYADLRNSRRGSGLDDGNHSTIMGVLADLGLTGGVPFVVAVICAGFVCINAYRKISSLDDLFERMFVLVAISALQTFVVVGVTSDLRTSPTINIVAYWFVGIVSSLAATRVRPAPDAPLTIRPLTRSARAVRWRPRAETRFQNAPVNSRLVP